MAGQVVQPDYDSRASSPGCSRLNFDVARMKRRRALRDVYPSSCGWYGIRIRPEQRRVEACPPESDAAPFFLPMKTGRNSALDARSSADDGAAAGPPAAVAERRETRRTDPVMVVGQLLDEVRRSLDTHPPSRERRTLLGKLQRLDTAVARWSAFPPHDDQVAAMLDVLNTLQASIPTGF